MSVRDAAPADAAPVLVTGAAGRVATRLRPALRARHRLRLTDQRDLIDAGGDPPEAEPARPGESFLRGDLADPGFCAEVTQGVAAIIHLAADTTQDARWGSLLRANLRTTAMLLDAAAGHAVPKIVYASSVHAAGGYNEPPEWPVDPVRPPRPCCRYGASKVAGEAMCRLYADQVSGASVIVLRLALVTYPPRWREEVRGWLADSDLVRLVDAALATDRQYGVYFGASASANPRYRVDTAESEIGYRPEVFVRPDGLPHERHRYADSCRLWKPAIHEEESRRV